MLTLQMIQLMDVLWKTEGLDLRFVVVCEISALSWSSWIHCMFQVSLDWVSNYWRLKIKCAAVTVPKLSSITCQQTISSDRFLFCSEWSPTAACPLEIRPVLSRWWKTQTPSQTSREIRATALPLRPSTKMLFSIGSNPRTLGECVTLKHFQ